MSLSISRTSLSSLCALITLVLLSILVFNVKTLMDDNKINEQIALLKQGEWVEAKDLDLNRVEVILAYAALQAELKLFDQAVETYSQAERFANHQQLIHIYYNLGNIHLAQAIEFGQQIKVDRAVAMADVAKDYYRSALEKQPDFWNAKYNYEAAQRLSRDLPLGELTENEDAEESSAELWSAMPGFPVGLP
jgi:mxaK protein